MIYTTFVMLLDLAAFRLLFVLRTVIPEVSSSGPARLHCCAIQPTPHSVARLSMEHSTNPASSVPECHGDVLEQFKLLHRPPSGLFVRRKHLRGGLCLDYAISHRRLDASRFQARRAQSPEPCSTAWHPSPACSIAIVPWGAEKHIVSCAAAGSDCHYHLHLPLGFSSTSYQVLLHRAFIAFRTALACVDLYFCTEVAAYLRCLDVGTRLDWAAVWRDLGR